MWKTIATSQTHELSEHGEVRKVSGLLLKGSITKLGYKSYFLRGRWELSHRLVAKIYLEQPAQETGRDEVNHIDGNKLNNHFTNLEWVTHSENVRKSYSTGQRKKITGANHWRAGVTVSAETRKKMSDKKLGDNHPKRRNMVR